jgi:diguanylate cyclase (GGDEF)-like protein/PAS domain S-box-containing protein
MATILIVDDHVLNREFLMTLLGYGGHQLLEAADGIEGLKAVHASHPDLVITDILMPHMDGYEFVTRMREDPDPDIAVTPIVFYTAAYREREATVMALACGVRWVLPKPSEPEAILETVHQALGLPLASQPPQPTLTAPPPEGTRFATIDNQLAEYLVEIETSSQLLSQLANGGKKSTPELEQMAVRLSKSLSSLQAVSLRLTALIELGIELAAEREPDVLLQSGCRVAQNICVAKYAVVGILSEDGTQLDRIASCGLEQEVQDQMAGATAQSTLFQTLLANRSAQRVICDGCDPGSVGLPHSHPPVNAVLGVPIASRAQVYGWLYLADKLGAEEFSEIDERAAATVASQLAVAYESLVFYEKIERQHAQLKIEMEERLQAQEALRKTLRARTVMAECNHVMVHATDEMTLLTDMCRTVVEVGGYRLAWIGYPGGEGKIIAQACTGADDSFLQACSLRRDCGELVTSPSAAVIRSGQTYTVADIQPEEGVDDWRRQAHARGYRSVLVLPMRDAGHVFGTLAIFESEAYAFDAAQIAMFEELVDDIAYGVVNFHVKEARAQAEQALQATEEKLSGILNSIDNVVWSASSEGLLYINPMAERIYGRPLSDFFQTRDLLFDVIHPEDRPHVRSSCTDLLQEGALTEEYRIVRPDGSIRWLEQRSKAVRDVSGQLLRIDAVATDITERKQYEARIEYLADHDALTGLANRNLLNDRVTQAMRQARRSGETLLALLFLDLDRFKGINDSYGHTVGDKLLKAVAARMQDTVREGDTVARQGGDEFIILLVGVRSPQDIIRAVAKIIQSFSEPYSIDGHQLHMTASIGVTVFPSDGLDLPTLLRNADTAMYQAKDDRGNAFQFYSREMSERAMERAEMETALRAAIERQEFELFYQPKVDIVSGRVIGAEALIRWHHPEMGLVDPQRFIPLAEEVGLIVPIGEWVLKTAHEQNKAWQDAGLAPLHIAVNLSVRQFLQDGLVESVAKVLQQSGLDGSYLELELTESMVMNNAEHFVVKLHQLKALGVQLSIDDFGTGYSSLSYLKRFPIDRLKIDQSFVRDSASNPRDAAIIRSVIDMGHSLDFKVIAEGVETREQLAFLRDSRCDEIQGYYFSRPVPAGDFAALFSAGWHLKANNSMRHHGYVM